MDSPFKPCIAGIAGLQASRQQVDLQPLAPLSINNPLRVLIARQPGRLQAQAVSPKFPRRHLQAAWHGETQNQRSAGPRRRPAQDPRAVQRRDSASIRLTVIGILLHGPPEDWGRQCWRRRITAGVLLPSGRQLQTGPGFIGGRARLVRDLFELAGEREPAVIFIGRSTPSPPSGRTRRPRATPSSSADDAVALRDGRLRRRGEFASWRHEPLRHARRSDLASGAL